jgi:transcriptional regulator with XRE-family HTH domain
VTDMTKILETIRMLRKNAGLRQEDIALILGLSRSSYNRIETGRRKVSLDEFLRMVSIVTDASIEDILRKACNDNQVSQMQSRI